MNKTKNKKIVVIAAISVLLLSSLALAINTSALQPKYGDVSFVLMSKDVESGETDFLSGVTVNLLSFNGDTISSTISTPTVSFSSIPYGNYVVQAISEKVGSYVYQETTQIITLNSSGTSISSLTMPRLALNKTLNLVVEKNGNYLVGATVSMFTSYGLSFFTGTTAYAGNLTAKIPFDTVTLKISYVEGGVNKVYYSTLHTYNATLNYTVDVGSYNHIYGTVTDSSTGKFVSTTIHVSLINQTSGALWQTLLFQNGIFDFYVPSTPLFNVVLTADGYNITNFPSSSGFYPIKLTPMNNNIVQNFVFSQNMQYLNYSYSQFMNNETIIKALPYNNIGVLYYQLKYIGYTNTDLTSFYNDSISVFTQDLIQVNNEVYQLYTKSVTPVTINYAGFYVNYTVTYVNTDLNVSKIISNIGYVPVSLYANTNTYYGTYLNYTYTLTIPSNLERSNDVTGANVTGWVNNINISNAQTSPLQFNLKERQKPEIILNAQSFFTYWSDMVRGKTYVVNQSISNYTIIVPANKQVFFNATGVPYDLVRDLVDYKNTTFNWVFDNQAYSGLGLVNVSDTFTAGVHTLNLTITDVGGNTNSTKITIYADGAYPDTYSYILYNSHTLIGWTVNYSTSTVSYKIGNVTGTASISLVNGQYNATLPNITVNESEMFKVAAQYTNDTINGHILSKQPVVVVWDVNNTKASGNYNNFTISYPTRTGNDWIYVTYTDVVNNSVTISIPIHVRDTMKPVANVVMYNVTKVSVHEIPEGSTVMLNGTKSYDPQGGTIISYNWTIEGSNSKKIMPGSIYTITNGSLNSSAVTLKFELYGYYYVLLNVSDASGNYNVYNATLQVSPVRPDLAVNNITWKGSFVEGQTGYLIVNISNNGNAPATTYNVILYVNGKIYSNTTYTNLVNGKSEILKVAWIPPSPGTYSIKIQVYTAAEPSIYLGDNVMSKSITVQQAAWKLPAMILGSIAIILVVGYVVWRYSKKRAETSKFQKKVSKKELKKESPKKEEKKE